MSTITLGTTSTAILTAFTITGAPSASDVVSISQGIYDDQYISATTFALTCNTSASVATVSTVSSFTGVNVGSYFVGPGIPPGTIILSTATATSQLTLSANATATLTATPCTVVPAGRNVAGGFTSGMSTITIPGRGTLKCLPGDVVAVDPQTGWPILLSKAAAAATAVWTHT